MAKNAFVKPTPAGEYPLGHAKENKDASAYTGFKYPSGGGNDIGVYKQPMKDPNSADIMKAGKELDQARPSIGNVFKSQPADKTDGIKIRGTGAATKGTKARGPMA